MDVYLEFAKCRKIYDNFFAIYELLQGLYGRAIDLVTDGSLSERKARVISNAPPIYGQRTLLAIIELAIDDGV